MVTAADLQFVTEVAEAAGQTALQYYGQARGEHKPDGSLVTRADYAAEQLIRRHLEARWPQDSIVGEELLGARDLSQPRVWCLDPIDGTHNFVAGLPLWAVSIGLCEAGRPTLGVVHAPLLDLTFTGAHGLGAFVNGRSLQPSRDEHIFPNDLIGFTTDRECALGLHLPHRARNLGSAALHACYGAVGVFKGAVFTSWAVWDLMAALAIGAEVGVEARTLDGKALVSLAQLDPHQRHGPLVVAPTELCSQLVASVREMGQ